jgi:hypothetical protein
MCLAAPVRRILCLIPRYDARLIHNWRGSDSPAVCSLSKGREMVITRVSPLSAAKVVGVLYALLGLLFGAAVTLAALVGAFAAIGSDDGGSALGALFGVGSIIILPIFYGCIGFVMTLLSAWLYNVVSGMVGGVEVDLR